MNKIIFETQGQHYKIMLLDKLLAIMKIIELMVYIDFSREKLTIPFFFIWSNFLDCTSTLIDGG